MDISLSLRPSEQQSLTGGPDHAPNFAQDDNINVLN
jgi:hypothetical protein